MDSGIRDGLITWRHFSHYWCFAVRIQSVTGVFPWQRASNAHLWCSLYVHSEQAVQQTEDFPVIWYVHYNDVTWTSWRLKSPANPLFVQPFVQAHIKQKTKALRHCLNPPVDFPYERPITRKMSPCDILLNDAHVMSLQSFAFSLPCLSGLLTACFKTCGHITMSN